jgi:hypothetical protein
MFVSSQCPAKLCVIINGMTTVCRVVNKRYYTVETFADVYFLMIHKWFEMMLNTVCIGSCLECKLFARQVSLDNTVVECKLYDIEESYKPNPMTH